MDNKNLLIDIMALRSPTDDRDLIYEEIVGGSLFERMNPSEGRRPAGLIRDQGDRSTCMAMAMANAVSTEVEKSAEWVWYHRAAKVDGMWARDALSILSKIGIVEETSYPYGNHLEPTLDQYRGAEKISGYMRLATAEGVKSAFNKGLGIIIVLPMVDNSLEFWRGHKKASIGHAVAVTGYNKCGIIFENSWGREWGLEGTWILPWSDWEYVWECWGIKL